MIIENVNIRATNISIGWFDENGEFHRNYGRPAVVYRDNYRIWYQHGKPHRKFGPAVIDENGDEYYYINGIEIDNI